jgi:beta-N-acetylhexosaminidase
MQAAIYGLSGERLTADERDFFRDADPAGYILFKRNVVDREQVRALTDEFRSLSGRDDLPILIDQEGGRVARLRPPVWPELPSAERFATLYRTAPATAIEATRLNALAIAIMLREVGVNVNCLPLLDVRQPDAAAIIGDRALGGEPMQVAALGRSVLDGMRQGGVVGVIKHMPGHGRALVDSHHELPVVDAAEDALEVDLEPFVTLRNAPMGMTAHVVYTAWDRDRCASHSPLVVEAIIRGRIGFDGFLMSDDLCMHALSGGFDERARRAVEAGCDVGLHCSGNLAEMQQMAQGVGGLSEKGERRLIAALATVEDVRDWPDYGEVAAKRDALLAYA